MIPKEQHAQIKRRLERGSRVDGDCRVWLGSTSKGYGSINIGSRFDGSRRTARVHRVAYEVFNGPIADGLFVCHRCDNPPCINPDHLFAGTRQDNVNDRETKGRNKPRFPLYGEDHDRSRLTREIVREIRCAPKEISNEELSKRYGVARRTVSDARRFKTWRPDPPETTK